MELDKIYRGMENGAETIGKNFEIVKQVIQDVENSKTVIESREIDLGFGLKGTIVKNGRMVWLNAFGNQINGRQDGVQNLTEKIPKGFIPQTTTGVAGKVLIGSNLQKREIFYRFETDGSMSSYSISMDAAPLTIIFSTFWFTK